MGPTVKGVAEPRGVKLGLCRFDDSALFYPWRDGNYDNKSKKRILISKKGRDVYATVR